MKRYLAAVLTVLLLLSLSASSLASGLVTDAAGELTSSELSSLNAMAQEIGDKYGIIAMIRLVDSTPGYTQSETERGYYGLRQYAADYYDSLYPGEDGVIFAVRLSDRWYVSVTTARGEELLTTSRLDAAEDEAKSYLSAGMYYQAFRTYLEEIGAALEKSTNPMAALAELLPGAGIFSAVITALVMLLVRRSMKTARRKVEAGDYVTSARITRRQDLYLYTTTTRTRIQSSSGSGGGRGGHFGGGGGGGHGSSHGGRF